MKLRLSRNGPVDRDPGVRDDIITVDTDALWKASLDHSKEVMHALRREPDFDSELLLRLVNDLTKGGLDAGDIVALYHHRKGKHRG
ncbi:MAG TPA: hypothetical protein VK573_10820 [Gemmatimonadales bacterium]|nr:hypothetical protein [Gemmatimonadales bacterium]